MIFTKLAAIHITDWLVQGGRISQEDKETCEFGLDKLFSSLTTLIFTLLFGSLFGIPVLAIVFFSAYTMLRVYAGGYHADTPLRCLFISIGIMIPVLLAIKFYHAWFEPTVFFSIIGISVIILILISPVGNKNKMLDALEKVVYRRRMLRNLTITSAFSVGLFQISYHNYAVSVLCGIFLAMAMAVAGKIKLLLQT